jgi:hypothetical protein
VCCAWFLPLRLSMNRPWARLGGWLFFSLIVI